jgi:small-conductance mechanosensitive channel
MNLFVENIPFFQIAAFLLAGLFLHFAFTIFNNHIIPFLKQRNESAAKWWQRFKIVAWLIYISLFFFASLQSNFLASVIFSIIIFGLGWSYWRNLFSGILIKFSDQSRIGDIISTDFAKGELKSVNLSHTKLLNDKKELVVIPNYILRNAVLKQLYKKKNVKSHSFTLTTKDSPHTETLYQLVLICPYISAHQEINIEKTDTNVYIIKVSIIDNAFIEKIRIYFRNALEGVVVSF